MSAPHVLPRGATPYVVTVDELDHALGAYYDAGHAFVTAMLDKSESFAQLAVMNAALTRYHALKADAVPEVLAAHARHRKTIAA